MNTTPFIVERVFNAPVSKVWKAISDKDEMKQWYLNLEEFRPELGFGFSFYGGKDPNKPNLHICVVTEVEHERELVYSWRFDGLPGMSYVSFELFAEGDKTRLKLTHSGIESFTNFTREDFSGWNYLIGTLLKDFVEKTTQNN